MRPSPSDVRNQLEPIIRAACSLATRQEAGQAETPLTNLFSKLASSAGDGSLRALVLGTSREAGHNCVREIVKHDYPLLEITVPSEIGYLELNLQEKGFSLQRGSSRQEFSGWDSFLAGLEESDVIQQGSGSNWIEPLRIGLPTTSEQRGVVLLVPEGLETLSKKPSLLSLLAGKADWILLSLDEKSLNSSELQTLRTLISEIRAWQSWPSTAHPFLRGVTDEYMGEAGMPNDKDSPFSQLIHAQGEGRELLLAQRKLRLLEGGLAGLSQNLVLAIRHAQNRIRLQAGGLVGSAMGGDQRLRILADELRQAIQDDLESVRRSFEDRNRATMAPGGAVHGKIAELVSSLSKDDITCQIGNDKVRLSLSHETISRLNRELLAEYERHLGSDLEISEEALEVIVENANQKLDLDRGKITHENADSKMMWTSICQVAHPEVRYKGEMPKLTMAARLSAARQGIMAIFMIVMVLGGAVAVMWGNESTEKLRYMAGAAMLPVFVVGFFMTFRSFAAKEKETMELELEKARESVLQELRRMSNEILREKNNQLGIFLQKQTKQMLHQVQEAIRGIENKARETGEKKKQESVSHIKTLELKIQALRQQLSELERLQTDASRIWRSITEWRTSWSKTTGLPTQPTALKHQP